MADRVFSVIPRAPCLAVAVLAAVACGTAVGSNPATTIALPTSVGPTALVPGANDDMWIATGDEAEGPIALVRGGLQVKLYGTLSAQITGLARATDGGVWFAASGANTVTRIDANGTVMSVPTGIALGQYDEPGRIAPGSNGAVWFDAAEGRIVKISAAGLVLHVFHPLGNQAHLVAADPAGHVWLAVAEDAGRSGRFALMSPAGEVSSQTPVVAADIDPAADAYGAAALDSSGALWYWDTAAVAPVRISTSGVTARGSSSPKLRGEVESMAVDGSGTVWIAATDPSAIASVATDGTLTTYGQVIQPEVLALGSDGTLWFGGRLGVVGAAVEQAPIPPPVATARVAVRKPMCAVPYVYGDRLGTAQAALQSTANCAVGTVSGPRNGVVWGQTPIPRKLIAAGSGVSLLLGRGAPTLAGLWQGPVTTDQCDENGGTTPSNEYYSAQLLVTRAPGGKLSATFGGGRLTETSVKGKSTSFTAKRQKLTVHLGDVSSVSVVLARYGALGCGEVDTYGSLSRTAGP